MKAELIPWSKNTLSFQSSSIRSEIQSLEAKLNIDFQDAECQLQLKEKRKQLIQCLEREEQDYQHKSKADWIQLGDLNTTYFHAICRKRQANNSINGLKLSNDSFSVKREEIAAETINVFQC